MTVRAHFDGKVIVPDEPTGLAPGTRLRVTLEPVVQTASPRSGAMDLLQRLPLIHISPEDAEAINRDPAFDIEES